MHLMDRPMDLHYTDAQEAFRAEVRAWLADHAPAPRSLPSLDTAEGFEAHRAWEAEMYADRWSVVAWPEEFGGRGVGILEWLVFEEEYWRAQAPLRVSQNGVFLLAPTMFEFGSDAQKARFLPPMASAQEIWCQGWSEPDAGSDLAGIRSRARRSDAEGGWVLSGQKTWASRGAFAEWCFGLFRTDPEAERHRGLTYFLVDMATPGVTVRPIPQIDGETGFAELFFEDVFVPDDLVLGEVGKGWNVAMATAGSVAQAWMDAEAYRLNTLWTATRVLDGGSVGPEASANKIHWSQTDLSIHRAALDLLGPTAELHGDGVDAPWLDGYLFALAGPIYAGTNEIQRNVVAERMLGLPRG
jgi:alkylation response protein AidB-like acyl-CoA dehydrogenase